MNIHKPNLIVLDLLESQDVKHEGESIISSACIVDYWLPSQEITFLTAESGNELDLSEAYQELFTSYEEQVTQS